MKSECKIDIFVSGIIDENTTKIAEENENIQKKFVKKIMKNIS